MDSYTTILATACPSTALVRCVDLVHFEINCKAMHFPLHSEVLQFAEGGHNRLPENGDRESARTRWQPARTCAEKKWISAESLPQAIF